MFKLTKAELIQRVDLVERLNAAATKVEEAIDTFNERLAEQKEALEAAVVAYNEILSEVREFAEEIATEAESAISDKSEKWQDGDKGQAATEFKDAWEGLSFDDLELDLPEELTFEAPGHSDDLENAPEEASS